MKDNSDPANGNICKQMNNACTSPSILTIFYIIQVIYENKLYYPVQKRKINLSSYTNSP